MNNVIYLEVDDEITAVIDKIRKSKQDGVVLVIPRGGTIGQSIVNLKLLKRSSEDLNKAIGLVTTDKISKNLAAQVKLAVFDNVKEAESAHLAMAQRSPARTKEESEMPMARSYKKYDLSKLNSDGQKPEFEEEAEDITESEVGAEEDEVRASENFDDEMGDEEEDDPEALKEERESPKTKNPIKVNISEDEEDEAPMQRNERRLRSNGTRKIFAVFAVILVVLAVGALGAMYYFLPYADASITLKTENLNRSLEVVADKNVAVADNAKLQLPGKPVELEKEVNRVYDATGQKDQGAKAKGKITISNQSTTSGPVLAKGTKVTAANDLVFTLDAAVMVPKATQTLNNCKILPDSSIQCDRVAGTVIADVTAAENGEQYNLAAATKFTIGALSATNEAAFAGGISKVIKYVSDDDLKNAETALRKATFDAAKKEVVEQAKKDGIIISEDGITDAIVTSDSDKKANEETEKFTYSMKLKYFVLGFSETELQSLVIANLSLGLPSDQMLVNPEESKLVYTVTEADKVSGIIKISATLDANVGKKLAPAAIAAELKNKSLSGAKALLNAKDGVASSSISVWPEFLTRTPILEKKIKVHFEYQK
jgi:hypothetical protein